MREDVPDPFEPKPVPVVRYGPSSAEIESVAETLLNAECPVIYAGQGVHYAQAWDTTEENLLNFLPHQLQPVWEEKVHSQKVIRCHSDQVDVQFQNRFTISFKKPICCSV